MITLKRVMASCSCLKKNTDLFQVGQGFLRTKDCKLDQGQMSDKGFFFFSTKLLPQICVTELRIDLLVKAVEDSLAFKITIRISEFTSFC